MKSSDENKLLLFGLTQAEFLNFTIYLFYCKSSNLKIWRLSKNARTFVLAITHAIFYILCWQQYFTDSYL
ncbi:hypothetical protein CXF67_08415 [Psychroflexus sp. MES1-P1E]|nr:hypothetical protein CXF67_08415 [Psychroflexus sp. MES1-P1E]